MGIADPNGDRVGCAYPSKVLEEVAGSPRNQCVRYAQSDGVAIACPRKRDWCKRGTVVRRDAWDTDGKRLR